MDYEESLDNEDNIIVNVEEIPDNEDILQKLKNKLENDIKKDIDDIEKLYLEERKTMEEEMEEEIDKIRKRYGLKLGQIEKTRKDKLEKYCNGVKLNRGGFGIIDTIKSYF